MCMRAKCQVCGKPTWSGCGAHIEQALAGVPHNERCQCKAAQKSSAPAGQAPKGKLFGLF